MPPARAFVLRILGLLTLAAAMGWTPAAVADDYSDVNTLLHSGKLTEALARADQYLAAKPRDPQMRFLKGVIQTQAGRTAEAIETYTALTQEYPELAEPYNNLAVLYAGQSQFEKARVALEQALRANPGYATALENLGDVYAKLAGISYSKAQQLDPANRSVAPKLALIRQLSAPPQAPAAQSAVPAPSPAASPPEGAASAALPASGSGR
jgi:tetratricopeptide (TPR) repeat protein